MVATGNDTFREKWAAALRSGKYRQAGGVLKDPNGAFCCLGVACDLIDSSKWTKGTQESPGSGDVGHAWGRRNKKSDRDNLTLPGAAALKQMGISDAEARLLAEENDDGASFETIADLIEGGRYAQ